MIVERVSVERDPVYEAEHQAFVDAAAGRREPESPAQDVLLSMEIAAVAMESWQKRTRVELPSLDANSSSRQTYVAAAEAAT